MTSVTEHESAPLAAPFNRPKIASSSSCSNPKKKRVRREKIELDHLRIESRKLQDVLAQLQAIDKCQRRRFAEQNNARSTFNEFSVISSQQNYRLIAPRTKEKRFVWQEIAERQIKERTRAQSQNRELRERLQAEFELWRELILLLHRKSNAKHLAALSHQRTIAPVDDESVVKNHLDKAENTLVEMEKVLRGPAFRDPTACFVDARMKKYGGKDVFVMESSMTLQFSARATTDAIWKVMATGKLKNHCDDHRVLHESDTLLSQAFDIHLTMDAFVADFRCKYTLSRFEEDFRRVIVWVAQYEPIQMNGLQYHNIHCQQVGWIELKAVKAPGLETTLARSYASLTVEFDDGVDNKELQSRSWLSLALPIHEKVGAWCSSLVETALIEEDCKLHMEQLSRVNWSSTAFGQVVPVFQQHRTYTSTNFCYPLHDYLL